MDLNPAVVFQPFFEGYSYALFMFHARCLIIFTRDYVLFSYCINDMTILSDLIDTSSRSRTRVRCPILLFLFLAHVYCLPDYCYFFSPLPLLPLYGPICARLVSLGLHRDPSHITLLRFLSVLALRSFGFSRPFPPEFCRLFLGTVVRSFRCRG